MELVELKETDDMICFFNIPTYNQVFSVLAPSVIPKIVLIGSAVVSVFLLSIKVDSWPQKVNHLKHKL